MASDSHFVVPAAAAGGIKRSHKSPNVADGYATKPCKKRVDRKDTPVGFDSDMTLGSDDFSHSAARGAAVPNKKKAKRDSDAIISPPHPKWNRTMDLRLRELVSKLGTLSWKAVSDGLAPGYSPEDAKHRWQDLLKVNRNRGNWTETEDFKLIEVITAILESGDKRHAKHIQWADVAAQMAWRDGKQCRDRWYNQLDPSIRRDEEAVVFEAQRAIGNKWCDIAKMLPGRTENSVKNLWNSHKRRLGRQTTLHPQDLSGNKIPALSSLGASISQEARQRARGVVQAEIEKCPAILLPPKSKGREQKASRKDSNSTHGAAAAHRSLVQAHSAHLTAQARAHRMAIAQHSSASGLRSTRQSTRTSSQQNEATQAHIVHVSAALVAAANRNAAAHLLPGLQSTFTPQPLTAPVTAGTYSQPATLRTVNIAVPSHPAQASAPGGSASGLPEPYSDNEEDDLPSPGSQNNTAHPFFQPTPTLDTHVIRSCSEHKRDSGGVPFLKLPPFAELLDDDAIMVPNGPAITRIPRMSPQGSLAAENSSGGNLGRGRGGTASTHDLDDVQSSVSGSMLDRSDFTRDDGSGVASHQGMLPGEGQRGPPLTEEALASIFHAQLGADNASTTLSRFRPHIEAAADYASGPGDSRLFPAFIASSPPKLLRGAAQLGQLYAAAYNAGFKAGTAVSIEEASFELQLTPTLGSAACKMLAAAQLSRGGWSPSAITEQVQQSLSKPSQAAGDPLGSSSKKSVSPHSSLACSATSPTHCSDTQAQRRGSAGGAPTESPRPFADAIEESAGGNPPTTQDTQQQWGAPQHGTPVSGEGGGGQWQSGHGTGFVVPGIGLQRGALRSASQAAAPCVLGTASSPSDGFAGSFLAVLRTNEASTCTPPTGIPPELSVGLSAPGSPGRGGLGLHKSSALTRSPGTMFLHSPDTLAKGGPPTNEDFGFLPSPAKDAQK